jgi:hypothetical protein
MSAKAEESTKRLLRQALRPVPADAGASIDLWPAVLSRLAAEPAQSWLSWVRLGSSWFDWALLAGMAAAAAAFPASIPLFLYYL